ncbi:MAG: 2-C-methyl-D-erythritol 4-phosphate cytidylyltransferase [Thermotoga sp.]|nr:MAG: 2-C-methyl-D-erythritol 4-phosphate cytidylyltransferase [Thermotoga sp.]
MRIIAAIMTAGDSSRFNESASQKVENKVFLKIFSKPIVNYSIDIFQQCEKIDGIYVVYNAKQTGWWEDWKTHYDYPKVRGFIEGGKTRQESVKNLLNSLDENSCDIILIQDGARPLVTQEIIRRVVEKVIKEDACIPVIPIFETIKRVEKDIVFSTIPREEMVIAQTPQGFKYSILRAAYEKVKNVEMYTDDASIVESAGYEVKCVEGDTKNRKITVYDDLAYIKALLYLREKRFP